MESNRNKVASDNDEGRSMRQIVESLLTRSQIDIENHRRKKLIDLQYEASKQEIATFHNKIRSENSLRDKLIAKQIVPTVYRATNGDIMLAQSHNRNINASNKIIDADALEFRIFFTRYEKLLQIVWLKGGDVRNILINCDRNGFENMFKALSAEGFCFLKCMHPDIKAAFYEFVMKEAKLIEVPQRWGWNLMMNGAYIFCLDKNNMEDLRNGS